MEPVFFATPDDFRRWLEKNHERASELVVGFHKKDSGRPSITWSESVDEALCFGWIDGIRRSVDDTCYSIRFTPRRRGSSWSAINVRKVQELTASGRMRPAGLQAFDQRDPQKVERQSFSRENPALSQEAEARFRANADAWSFFESQPPSYRRIALWWVVSAKREDTRERRLQTLMEDSAAGRRIALLRQAKKN